MPGSGVPDAGSGQSGRMVPGSRGYLLIALGLSQQVGLPGLGRGEVEGFAGQVLPTVAGAHFWLAVCCVRRQHVRSRLCWLDHAVSHGIWPTRPNMNR